MVVENDCKGMNICKIQKRDEKMEDEKVNRELMVAERDIDKTMNYKLYEDEIKNRPKKRWFESKKDKMKRLKEMRKEFNKKKEDLYS